jgi:transcriptional regulator with XRE-family HTH domain
MGKQKGPQAAAVARRFGRSVAQRRRQLGLTREGTAERAGLHPTEVALVERGRRIPRLDTLVKLAGAVEATPCELLAGMSWRLDGSRGRST